MTQDCRDDYPLSDAIREAHIEGVHTGESWSMTTWITEDRDYAVARADALEGKLREADRLLRGFVYDDYEGERHGLTVDATAWLAGR